MNQEQKDKLNQQIEQLNEVLNNLNTLDQNNPKVQEQINLIKEQITELKISTMELNKYIPLYKRVYKNLFNSKTIAINVIWLSCEFLNSFTDIFSGSHNSFIIMLRTVVPGLTIFLRTIK